MSAGTIAPTGSAYVAVSQPATNPLFILDGYNGVRVIIDMNVSPITVTVEGGTMDDGAKAFWEVVVWKWPDFVREALKRNEPTTGDST